MIVTKSSIAKKHGVSRSFITMLVDKEYNKFTENLPLAYDLAKLTGRKPKLFLAPKWRKLWVQVLPNLEGK